MSDGKTSNRPFPAYSTSHNGQEKKIVDAGEFFNVFPAQLS